MIKKLLEIYKIYFLISLLVSCLVVLANYESTPTYVIIPAILMSFIIPFVYELDYIFYSYLIEPEAKFSQDIRSFINRITYRVGDDVLSPFSQGNPIGIVDCINSLKRTDSN